MYSSGEETLVEIQVLWTRSKEQVRDMGTGDVLRHSQLVIVQAGDPAPGSPSTEGWEQCHEFSRSWVGLVERAAQYINIFNE